MMKSTFVAALISSSLFAQGPGRGIPDLSEPQRAALTRITAELAPQIEAVTQARAELTAAAFAGARDEAAIRAQAEEVHAAELALANARATYSLRFKRRLRDLRPIRWRHWSRRAVVALQEREEGGARSRTSGRRKPTRSSG